MKRKNSQISGLRAKPKLTKRPLWSTTDRLQLLAYLNWCVQHHVKFEATAPGYLENATGKHFSQDRIRRKLYQEWQSYGTCEKFNDLLELGTAALLPFLGDEQEHHNQILASISPDKPAHFTSSRYSGLAARSRALAEPGSINSVGSSRKPNEFSTPQSDKSNLVPKRPRQKTNAKPSWGPTRLASNDDLGEDELASDDNTDSVQGEEESELSMIASPELSDDELEFTRNMLDSQKNTVTVISQARLSSSPEPRSSQLEALLIKQKAYSLTLENRISELERRNSDLNHCINNASSAPGIFNGVEVRLRQEISNLKEKLSRKGLLIDSYKHLESDRLGFLNTSLRVEYGNLHSNIVDTSANICSLSLEDTLPQQRADFSPLANNWARRIGGCDLGFLLGHCESAQIPKKLILVSLLAAGIFDLVLGPAFPAFLAADSPLLDQYRKHIETQWGRNALQRLDIISIKSFASDPNVRIGIFSERSNRVSNLILESLSFFLPLESRYITQRSRHNDLETEIIEDMRNTLHHAFNVKIELMLSLKRLKHLFFRSGTLFDGNKMKAVKSQAGDSALLGREVLLCLLPALFVVSETNDETGVEEETSLSATYSKALAEVTDEDAASLILVEKAIVFLKI